MLQLDSIYLAAIAGAGTLLILLLTLLILSILTFRRAKPIDLEPFKIDIRNLGANVQTSLALIEKGQEHLESVIREENDRMRAEIAAALKGQREELTGAFETLSRSTGASFDRMSADQKERLDGFSVKIDFFSQSTGQRLDKLAETLSGGALEMRSETAQSLKALSETVAVQVGQIATALTLQSESLTTLLGQRIEQMRVENAENAKTSRVEIGASLHTLGQTLDARLVKLVESSESKQQELKTAVETKMEEIRVHSEKKLDEMRQTVDEKLQGTLEKRLGESFKQVSDRLEQVHKGLGEMQTLAIGVGDLKKVLTNVKVRGTLGEVQLERLLEQIFAPSQYVKNYSHNNKEFVEFAVKVSGRDGEGDCMMPIDAKYPIEDYGRLVSAIETGDLAAADTAGKQIEMRIKNCARDIKKKYISPPLTTPFGVLFLPVEGLYAEVLRRPGLAEDLQRDFRVIVAGPTTLLAILSGFQMSLTVNAITKRAEEVWRTLGAVKTEFHRYGDMLDKVKKNIHQASTHLDTVSTRTRAVERKLKAVEQLPEQEAQIILGGGR